MQPELGEQSTRPVNGPFEPVRGIGGYGLIREAAHDRSCKFAGGTEPMPLSAPLCVTTTGDESGDLITPSR